MEPATPEDAINEIKRQEARDSIRLGRVLNERSKAEKEAELLKVSIEDNANPHPVVITLCVIGALIGLWIIYLLVWKPNASGEWYDDSGNLWTIWQNRITGSVYVFTSTNNCNGSTPNAKITDNLFIYDDQVGIWDYNNVILLVAGGGLTRANY